MATDQPAADIEERPARRRLRVGRVGKWLLGIAAAFVLLIVGALVVLNTPLGERFLASRIAERTFPNGLNIRIGRIEGNLYGAAVLHDVRLSDPEGVFLTIPRAEAGGMAFEPPRNRQLLGAPGNAFPHSRIPAERG